MYRMKNSHGLGTRRDSHEKEWRISDDLGLREPSHSETFFAKKRYTSIVERVRSHKTIDPRAPTLPGRSTSGFHQP